MQQTSRGIADQAIPRFFVREPPLFASLQANASAKSIRTGAPTRTQDVGEDPIPLDENHIDLAKPRDKDQLIVEKARELVTLATRGMTGGAQSAVDPSKNRMETSGENISVNHDSFESIDSSKFLVH